jgi:hypothetical protein
MYKKIGNYRFILFKNKVLSFKYLGSVKLHYLINFSNTIILILI